MSAARDVALALAGRRAQRLADGFYLIPCPVLSHGKGRGDLNPSLRIGDGETRLLVHCFGGCDRLDVLDELRRRGLLDDDTYPRPARGSRSAPSRDEVARKRIRQAREIWNAARDPRGTLAEIYLCLRRLALDDALAGRVLCFHPRTPWRNENTGATDYLPALIAAFRSIDGGTLTAIHRIRLDQPERWPKAERRMLGIVHHAAIKLDDDVGDELAIGEGVETCIAARLLGIRPTWALGSAGGIAHFPVLPKIRTLRLIGENDRASEQAIEQCGKRWTAAGRRVRIVKPSLDCSDLNDVVSGGPVS